MTLAEILHPSCALFLDFDGTMVDIAAQPQACMCPAPDRRTPGPMQHPEAMAVISGRPIAQIDEFLLPLQLAVAGVHGSERRGADGEMHLLHTHPLDHVEAAARAGRGNRGCWWKTSAAPSRCTTASGRSWKPCAWTRCSGRSTNRPA